MKRIFMLQGMGNNERGWARLVSKFGHVTLIQQGMVQHVEIWEDGKQTFTGPDIDTMRWRTVDEMTFNLLSILRCLARCREFTRGEKIDVVIASNYNMGMAALLLRMFGKARKVAVFLTDFLPPQGSFAVRLHRQLTKVLTRFVAKHADEVWAVSPRIPTATANPRNFVVPLYIENNQMAVGSRQEIGYVGIPSPDHALDILFEICKRHHFRLNIIGNSDYLQTIKHLAPPDTVFHGMLNDAVKINEIFSRCFCGYAVYLNTGPQSYSYYGIPSKTFFCFASNTPVVTTNTAHFTQNIEKFGVGRVVMPVAEEIESAVLELKEKFSEFYDAIGRFRKIWNEDVEKFHRERLSDLMGQKL